MTIPDSTLDLARASLGLYEVGYDSDYYTVDEWSEDLVLSTEKTRKLLQQGEFDGTFTKRDVLRTMVAGSSSDLSAYVEKGCYKYVEVT
jgi:hypothetical protein